MIGAIKVAKLELVPGNAPAPPYPANTSNRGFFLALDVSRFKRSDTWVLCPMSLRNALVRTWVEAWDSTPVGALTDDDDIIAARIDIDAVIFAANRKHLLRGFVKHSDGRLYHPMLVDLVRDRLDWREAEKTRKAEYRKKKELEHMSHGTDTDGHGKDDTGAVAVAVAGALKPLTSIDLVSSRLSGARVKRSPPDPTSKGTALQHDTLPDVWREWAMTVHKLDVQRVTLIWLKFRDHWKSTSKNYTKRDWLATWRNWVRKECGE